MSVCFCLEFPAHRKSISNGKVYITASATNLKSQRDALTQSAAKRSLEPLRHATRAGQGRAIVRDFVQHSKKSGNAAKRPTHRRGFFDAIGDAFSNAKDALSGAANNAVDVVSDAAGNVGDAISGAADQVGDAVHNVGDTIVDGAQDAVGAIGDGIDRAGDTIGQVIDTTTGVVKNFVHAVSACIKSRIKLLNNSFSAG